MMVFSLAVIFVLLLVILLADMDDTSKIISTLAALMFILIPATHLFSVEKGKEIVLNSLSTSYTKTELYNMSDAEKDLLPKTYGGAIVKYWKIEENK